MLYSPASFVRLSERHRTADVGHGPLCGRLYPQSGQVGRFLEYTGQDLQESLGTRGNTYYPISAILSRPSFLSEVARLPHLGGNSTSMATPRGNEKQTRPYSLTPD